ncbi:MAG: nucleoside triphosphate pyrophosphohydrolase [Alphaproteobacteria bacterium]|nr:MAG: nucleoside triphosphate pyrophosphohydrolase [Alphaproteobacteria bacterium]
MTRTAPLPRPQSDALVHDRDAGLERLEEIMRRLRAPEGGCPWDLEQDFDSIAPYTIEEAHEVADAIARRAWDELPGELGDLMLQVVYHAQMAAEAGLFDLDDVIGAICDKMIARHPHVFGAEAGVKTAAQQTRDWEAQKAAERGAARTLDGVALGLPALTRAVKLQRRAARVGFDWPETSQVLDKLAEEIGELEQARQARDADALEDEFGDILFVMANLARHLDIDPEAALRRANAKFARRFAAIEDRLAARGRSLQEATLEEMDAIWNEVRAEDNAARDSGSGEGRHG